ncbi:MAG: LysR family transcriptional regulator, partial [Chloroflexi bacterium]|nr:LysR family transcriptional regulator [Chloroflexota bacterium]
VDDSSSAKPQRLNGASAANQLNFHQLYLFYTVASHHSFSKAAQALAITQPAVSIQIQELEKSMGVTLFHRRSKGLRVTDAGETVYAYAQQIFALSGKLLETLQEAQDLKTGHLVLGASTTPGEYVLPQAVGQFRRLYPGIQLELIIANTRSIVQRILSGEIDLGMVGERPQQHSGELEIIDYMEDEIVLVAAPNHPMAQLSSLSAQQVVDEGLIVREVGSATRQTAERHLESLGAFPRVALELGSNEAVKQAAAAGGGIGVVSRLGVTAEVKAGMLTVLKVEGWNCRRPLTLVYPKDRYLSPAQRAFRSFLIDRKPVSG